MDCLCSCYSCLHCNIDTHTETEREGERVREKERRGKEMVKVELVSCSLLTWSQVRCHQCLASCHKAGQTLDSAGSCEKKTDCVGLRISCYSPSLSLHLFQLEVLMVDILHQRGGAWTAIKHIGQQLGPCVMQCSERERERERERAGREER